MDQKIRVLIVTDQPGQRFKLENIFKAAGFNVVVTGDTVKAGRLIFQECDVVLCRTLIGGDVPRTFIDECRSLPIPIVAMSSNPAHFAEWKALGIEVGFDSDYLMGTGRQAEATVKECAVTLRSLAKPQSR